MHAHPRWYRRSALSVLFLFAASSARADGPSPAAAASQAPASTAASSPPPAPPRAPAIDADWVGLTVRSDDAAVAVYAKDSRSIAVGDVVTDGWTFVCKAPCGQRVDPRRTYRVMGEGLIPSVEFNLAPGSGSVALQARARHVPSAAATVTLATTGGVTALGGVLFLLLDLAEHGAATALGKDPSAKKSVDSKADTYGDIGAGMLAGGVALGGAALIYLLTAGKTELSPAEAPPRQTSSSSGVRWFPLGFSF